LRTVSRKIYKWFDGVVQDETLPYSVCVLVWHLSIVHYFFILLQDDWRLARNWAVFKIEKRLDSPKWRSIDERGSLKT